MSRFLGEQTMYYVERVDARRKEERLMTYDRYDKTWKAVSEFKNAEGSTDLAYLQSTAQGMTEMEQIKVQFGMVSEPEFEYNIIQKDDNSYRIDKDGNKIEEAEETPPKAEEEDIPPEVLPE